MAELVTLPGIKTQFAAGLSWRHADKKPTSKELRDIGLGEGRWGMVRTSASGHFQVGSCDAVEGAKSPKGVRPLAALVADHHREPWMGLFPLGDGRYWYIAVRDGGEVITGGDRIGSFDECMRVRDEHANRFGEWNEVPCKFEDLVEIVGVTARQPGLRDLTVRPWVPVLYMGGLIAVLGGCLGFYVHLQDEDAREAQAAAKARRLAVEAAQQATVVAASRVLPWTREPMASETLEACHRAWAAQRLVEGEGAWTLVGWHCLVEPAAVTIKTTWTITDALAKDVANTGGLAKDAPGQLDPTGSNSNDSVTLPVRFGRPSPHALGDEEARRGIWTISQSNALKLTLAPDGGTPTLPGAPANEPAPWLVWSSKFAMDMPPWTDGLAAEFAGLPGFRVHSIDLTLPSGQWTMNSTLYSLRPAVAQAALPGREKNLPARHTAHRRST